MIATSVNYLETMWKVGSPLAFMQDALYEDGILP